MTPTPAMPELPTHCMHGPRCQIMRAEHERFECAAFPPNHLAPKRARHLVLLAIAAWKLDDLADTTIEVAIAASELTTNALRHGRIAVRVDARVYVEHRQFVFEVEDRGPGRPQLRSLVAARNSGSGFGLRLVADLADDWGFEYFSPDHKRVWASWDVAEQSSGSSTQRSPAMNISDQPKVAYPGDRRAWTVSGDPASAPTPALAVSWCRGTITGPWGLPESVADAATDALTSMLSREIGPDDSVTVRVFRALSGHASIVSVVVDDQMIQLAPVEQSFRTALSAH